MSTPNKDTKGTKSGPQKVASLFTGELRDADDPDWMTFTERPGRGCLVHIRLTPREEKAIRRMATEDGYVDEIIWLKSIFLAAVGWPPVDPLRTNAEDLERND
jgi:hypothetical protein